jgi:hypothetical protein
MPVGDYNKDYFLLSGLSQLKNRLKKFNPNADIDEYGLTTKILRRYNYPNLKPIIPIKINPKSNSKPIPKYEETDKESMPEKVLHYTKNINPTVGAIASIPSNAMTAYNAATTHGLNSNLLYNVMTKAESIAKPAEIIGKASNAVGGVLSGVSLAKDITDLVNGEGDKFENALNIADDAGGIISAGVSAVNPIAGLAVTAVEKVGEAIARGAKAVADEKKKEGVKHLKPKDWFRVVEGSVTPDWWSIDIGSKDWHDYWNQQKNLKKQQRVSRLNDVLKNWHGLDEKLAKTSEEEKSKLKAGKTINWRPVSATSRRFFN